MAVQIPIQTPDLTPLRMPPPIPGQDLPDARSEMAKEFLWTLRTAEEILIEEGPIQDQERKQQFRSIMRGRGNFREQPDPKIVVMAEGVPLMSWTWAKNLSSCHRAIVAWAELFLKAKVPNRIFYSSEKSEILQEWRNSIGSGRFAGDIFDGCLIIGGNRIFWLYKQESGPNHSLVVRASPHHDPQSAAPFVRRHGLFQIDIQ